MVGSTETADGKKGFVPAPDKGPPNRFLNSSGIWIPPEGGSADTATKALQDGDGNVISGTYVKTRGGTLEGRVRTWYSPRDSAGTGNYVRFAKISIGGRENSFPLYMTLGGKYHLLVSVAVVFENVSNTDPGLKYFRTSGEKGTGHGIHIAKTAAGQWHLFARSNYWDYFAVGNFLLGVTVQPNVEFEMTIVGSLPTGAIAATEVASIL